MFFTPLSKVLAVYGKPRFLNHAIALVTVFVFVVIGAWHGVGWHYIWFGLLHALGVVINHYYAILLKRTMGVKRFKVYCESVVVRVAAIVLTFIYVSGTFAFFANDSAKWRQIVDALR
jgi:D-alanyl-lipoteichoic acid acyltransferase DltB (MBOAT superfamily)